MSSEVLHVAREKLKPHTLHLHYAITSLMEELEAVDWYRQRADDTDDPDLRAVLLHTAKEELENASMLFEGIRRTEPLFEAQLREYLFTDKPIVEVEHEAMDRGSPIKTEEPSGKGAPVRR